MRDYTVEADIDIRIRNGRLVVNDVECEHAYSRQHRIYMVATPLRDSPELRRVIRLALDAGRHLHPARLPVLDITRPN